MNKTAIEKAPTDAESILRRLITTDAVNHLDLDAFIVNEVDNHSRALTGNRYADSEFRDLMASIRERGVMQPILYTMDDRGQPHVRVGYRRLEAAKRVREAEPANPCVKTIPSIEIDSASASDVLALLKANLEENSRRKPMTPLDQANAVEAFAATGLSNGNIARAMRIRSAGTITKLRALYGSSEKIKQAVHAGEMDLETAYELSRKPEEVQHAVESALPTPVPVGAAIGGKGTGRSAANAPAKRITRSGIKAASIQKGKLKVPSKAADAVKAAHAAARTATKVAVKQLARVKKLGIALTSVAKPRSARVAGAALCAFVDGRMPLGAAKKQIVGCCMRDAKVSMPFVKAPATKPARKSKGKK